MRAKAGGDDQPAQTATDKTEQSQKAERRYLHIDGSKSTVGDGAADSTGEGEAGVEGEAAQLLGLGSLDILDNGVELGRAGGFRVGGHCDLVGGLCGDEQTNKTLSGERRDEAVRIHKIQMEMLGGGKGSVSGQSAVLRDFFFFWSFPAAPWPSRLARLPSRRGCLRRRLQGGLRH